MLSTFLTLKNKYESKELLIDDLKVLQQHPFIGFENKGISRSNLDCLLCEVICLPYAKFLKQAISIGFESLAAMNEYITLNGLGLIIRDCDDTSLICFTNHHKQVEIYASVDSVGRIGIEADDIELQANFQVFLRVQH